MPVASNALDDDSEHMTRQVRNMDPTENEKAGVGQTLQVVFARNVIPSEKGVAIRAPLSWRKEYGQKRIFRLRFESGRLCFMPVGLNGANSLRDSHAASGTLSSHPNAVNGCGRGVSSAYG
jgi:hypothetical protein